MCPESKKLLKIVQNDGWQIVRGNSSGHIQLTHSTKPGRVTIPIRNVKKNIIKSVIKQAGLSGGISDYKNGRIS